MGEVYTPGLLIAREVRVGRMRSVTAGRVMVSPGQPVDQESALAYANPRGYLHVIDARRELGGDPELESSLLKKEGDRVHKGEVIARRSLMVGMLRRELRSPVNGTIERISTATARISLREDPVPVTAPFPGRVASVVPGVGVVVETVADVVQGIFGVGGEATGRLISATGGPGDILDARALGPEHSGKVVIGGSAVTEAALRRAAEVWVRAIVTGSVAKDDLDRFVGRVIGAAVTGHEPGPVVIVTEGFGRLPMSDRAYDILTSNIGRIAYVSGRTQVRAGVVRPEVLIPTGRQGAGRANERAGAAPFGLSEGSRVRVIRGPAFGRLGVVGRVLPGLTRIATGSMVRALEIVLDQPTEGHVGRTLVVPRSNVELLIDGDRASGSGDSLREGGDGR